MLYQNLKKLFFLKERSNAIPHYHRPCNWVSCTWRDGRSQHTQSALEERCHGAIISHSSSGGGHICLEPNFWPMYLLATSTSGPCGEDKRCQCPWIYVHKLSISLVKGSGQWHLLFWQRRLYSFSKIGIGQLQVSGMVKLLARMLGPCLGLRWSP